MNCKIIQDLLPLYADGIASEETNEAVREHIAECEECGKIYEKMTESPEIIESPQNDRDVDYMKKIKSRGRKITAAIVGGLFAAAAIVLLCLKLFYWGFAVSSEDIDILCTMNGHGSGDNSGVYIEFTAEMKNGMALRYDFKDYTHDGCIYTYITPRAVLKKSEKLSQFITAYHMYYNTDGYTPLDYELNIILEDTSYKYDIEKMTEEFRQSNEEELQNNQ